jgi:DNA-binding transcriptional MerR regulator
MTVHELARRVGIAPHVVRYYSQRGLLSPARNARNAYRQYGETDLHRLKFIFRAKSVGFTLNEISVILRAADGEDVPGRHITELVQQRAQQNEKRLGDAQRLHRRICAAVNKWSAETAGPDVRELVALIDAVALED